MELGKLTENDRQTLIYQIAHRTAKASELAKEWHCTPAALKTFVDEWRLHIEREAYQPAVHIGAPPPEPEQPSEPPERADSVSPQQLADLWITNKFERLKRLQAVAEETEQMIMKSSLDMSANELAMAVREFRSYLMLAANELGQLLHRGAGDAGTDDTLSINIAGVDMENLR